MDDVIPQVTDLECVFALIKCLNSVSLFPRVFDKSNAPHGRSQDSPVAGLNEGSNRSGPPEVMGMKKVLKPRPYSAEFPEFSKQEVCNLLMFPDSFESLDGTLISLRALALALTLAGLTDFTGTGQRKKAKSSRRTTLKKPLAFSL